MARLQAPSATASGEVLADWLELIALSSPRRTASAEDLVGALGAIGATDALVDSELDEDDPDIADSVDPGSERAQALAETALSLAEERGRSMRRAEHYPFVHHGGSIEARPSAFQSTYTYLLLLSRYGIAAGPPKIGNQPRENGAELFEGVAAVAAKNYLGGAATGAVAYQFGFPRLTTPARFGPALDKMCAEMAEGGGAKRKPGNQTQMDAKLDLAVWIPMPDQRPGKVIGFGQCATGDNWPSKVSELQAEAWCAKWMQTRPAVLPLRLFFLPHRIDGLDWLNHSYDAGIIFDRCRLTAYANPLPAVLRQRVQRWSQHVLQEQLGR